MTSNKNIKKSNELKDKSKINSNPETILPIIHDIPAGEEYIEIKNAKVHNLKNVTLKIPKNKLVVFTGVSGSGKSSLAFDTLYAEGQRRYVESLSSYARQFLGLMEKPDVESITGLSPAISIDQKTSGTNPRSTVGTITEIYDYLRLLYARIGRTYCPNCGELVQSQTIDQIIQKIIEHTSEITEDNSKDAKSTPSQTETLEELQLKTQILAPLIQDKKGTYNELFERLLNKGFLRIRIDGETYNLDETSSIKLEKFEKHNIDLVVDRLILSNSFFIESDNLKRLRDALELASSMANGEIKVLFEFNNPLNNNERDTNPSKSTNSQKIPDTITKEIFFSEHNTCLNCHISFPKVTPASFSFNSPQGACEKCAGLGSIKQIDIEKIYNPNLSILEGGIFPWSNMTTTYDSWTLKSLETVAMDHKFSLSTPIKSYSKEIFDLIFFGIGSRSKYAVNYRNRDGLKKSYETKYEGVVTQLERRYKETDSDYIRQEIEKYMYESVCSDCHGKRLKPYALSIKINEKNIEELTSISIIDSATFLKNIELKGIDAEIAKPVIKEILTRLEFLNNVGLDYLTLNRRANTLSGGESQRIRLASQIGTGLTGVLYVLDEPSIGLHSKDVSRLIDSLESMKNMGNSVIVVEHDYDTIRRADWITDIGPFAGKLGGEVIYNGNNSSIEQSNSLTAKYLSGTLQVGQSIYSTSKDQLIVNSPIESETSSKNRITMKNITTNNLKNVDIQIPIGKFVCVTGVSGSGKSSLINDTLYPALLNRTADAHQNKLPEGQYSEIKGIEGIKKVIGIDQSPIGRTPRSNPATYTGVFNYIRELFTQTPEARARGFTSGRFSFNVKGGRCETCRGEGQIKIEMQFLPDMYVTCEDCNGKRYNEDALQIDYKGKNIADVLDMTVSEALIYFENISQIRRKLELLNDVGLGYIKLGQSATTLSGGESQRIKLARELSKVSKGETIYILDEPTTGLHFYDVDKLLLVLKKLVDKGSTVIVIEHNLDVIRYADWVIDLGPEGGEKGGEIIEMGSIEKLMQNKKSYTGIYLKEYLESLRPKISQP